MKQLFVYGLLAAFVLAIIFLVSLMLREPRTDRVWDESLSRSTYISEEADVYTFHNVRDWTYGPNEIVAKEWRDTMSVAKEDIVGAWFLLEPFSEWERVGHTYLTFEFANGDNLSFSVEARKELGEEYSAFRGLFREYELSYTWGTERDFLTRRLLYLDHNVRMYPLAIEPAVAQTIFVSLVTQTNDLNLNPRFYNTLTQNCTNVLAKEMNVAYPGSIPRDISWYLPGTSDIFLMEQGYITVSDSQEAMLEKHNLRNYYGEVVAVATSAHAVFSTEVRRLLTQ